MSSTIALTVKNLTSFHGIIYNRRKASLYTRAVNSNNNTKSHRFTCLVETYSTDLYRYGLWLSGNKEIAEDLVQECFARAWKNLHQLNDNKKEKSWLFTILRNENARRFQRQQPTLVDIEEFSIASNSELEPEQQLQRRHLQQAIMKLETIYREPIIMQVLLGHSCRVIAETLEISESAVMTRLFRAKQMLKETLGQA